MTSPLVTVVIDTYNYGQFIEQAIESVMTQDFPRDQLEILVVDDGSTDDTAERVKGYGARVQYLPKANGGQGSAFNLGVSRARGKLIAFLDADDYFLPGKLQRITEEFAKSPVVGMVHHGLREVDTATGEVRERAFTPISGDLRRNRKAMLRFMPTPTSSLAFRRELLQKIFPIPDGVRIQADGYLQALAPLLAPIVGLDESLAVYRVHGGNLYFLSNTEADLKRRRLRATTLEAIVHGLGVWLRANGYRLSDSVVRASLNRWTLLLEREEFALNAPGRIKFFLHLMKSYRHNHSLFGWQIRAENYVDSIGALLVGYKRFHVVGEGRQKLKAWLRGGAG